MLHDLLNARHKDITEHGLNRLKVDFEHSKVYPSFQWKPNTGIGLEVRTRKDLEVFGLLNGLELR